ncbi:hypothetical protein ACXWP3_09610, partial [Streptococcus pyogenes]
GLSGFPIKLGMTIRVKLEMTNRGFLEMLFLGKLLHYCTRKGDQIVIWSPFLVTMSCVIVLALPGLRPGQELLNRPLREWV